MIRKVAILFAILAVASAALNTNSPASVFAVAPGKLFTNGTDTAFTALSGPCYYTGGFDNTTNYVWCQTAVPSTTVAYAFQRRAINATSPSTINATADAKLTSSQYAATNGQVPCGGLGYFGFAVGYGSGSGSTVKPDVILYYAAVNATSFTKVTLTANTDANIVVSPKQCLFDAGIFYVVYTYNAYDTTNKTQNGVWIQAVNVTSGAVYYNSTGGVKLWSPTTQSIDTLGFTGFVGNNQTGYATQGLLTYTDSNGATATVGSKYNLLPITLSTGAAGSVVTLATGAQATPSGTTSSSWVSTSTTTSTVSSSSTTQYLTTYYTRLAPVGTSVSEVSVTVVGGSTLTTATVTSDGTVSYETSVVTSAGTHTVTAATTTSTTTSTSTYTGYTTVLSVLYPTSTITSTQTTYLTTSYSMSAFGSLSTYGVVLMQTIDSYIPLVTASHSYTYANSIFINGSSTAATTANLTNPSGYHLSSVQGFATTENGFCLLETFASDSGAASAVYKDLYYYNGTQVTGGSASIGTYESSVQGFPDATGSIWVGYTAQDSSLSPQAVYAGYAGEVLYQALSANTLASIFATLTIMIAALFAF